MNRNKTIALLKQKQKLYQIRSIMGGKFGIIYRDWIYSFGINMPKNVRNFTL